MSKVHIVTSNSEPYFLRDVISVLETWGGERRETEIERISVSGAGEESVNCDYTATSAATIPRGFIDVCLVSCGAMIQDINKADFIM